MLGVCRLVVEALDIGLGRLLATEPEVLDRALVGGGAISRLLQDLVIDLDHGQLLYFWLVDFIDAYSWTPTATILSKEPHLIRRRIPELQRNLESLS